jgi:class 3 adenylate cyclase
MSSQGKGHRKLAAIMFTDMVGYSAMTQKNEALTLELLEEHKHLLRPIFPKYEGKEISTIGDAFFVEFASALDAAGCAIEIQRILLERNNSVSPERQVRIRIGLHIGDVVHLGDHVHGDGANIAARIEPLAEPGGICISEDVARQIQNKIDMPIVKLGGGELKNIKLPVNIQNRTASGEEAFRVHREIIFHTAAKKSAPICRWNFNNSHFITLNISHII